MRRFLQKDRARARQSPFRQGLRRSRLSRDPSWDEHHSSAKPAELRRRDRRSLSWRTGGTRTGRRTGFGINRHRGLISVRLSFFLFRSFSAAPETVDQIFQIATYDFLEQICFGAFQSASHFKIDCRVTRFFSRLKICADRFEELFSDFFIDRQPRVQMQLAAETYRSRSREMDVW